MKMQPLRFSIALLLVAVAATMLWAKPAAAQASEPDDREKLKNYSLYYESYKNKDYAAALPYLQWILENAPAFGGPGRTTDNNFERAAEVYGGLAAQGEGEAYADSALAIFDRAPAVLQAAGVETSEVEWLIKKGRYVQQTPDAFSSARNVAAEAYLKAIELAPEEVDAYSYQYVVDTYVANSEIQKAADLLNEMKTIFADNADVQAYIVETEGNLFPDGPERLAFLMDQIESNPGDVELLTEALELAMELNDSEAVNELGPKLLDAEPSARVYRLLADIRREDGQYQEAIDLYEQALEQSDASEYALQVHYGLGQAYQQTGNLSQARRSFQDALREDASYGPALMAIGDLYATAVSECGSMEVQDRAVYWLVVDYFNRAKQAEPRLSNQANQKIRTYQNYYPTQEMLFFRNLEPGQSYTVEGSCYGWIGESTTVKAP